MKKLELNESEGYILRYKFADKLLRTLFSDNINFHHKILDRSDKDRNDFKNIYPLSHQQHLALHKNTRSIKDLAKRNEEINNRLQKLIDEHKIKSLQEILDEIVKNLKQEIDSQEVSEMKHKTLEEALNSICQEDNLKEDFLEETYSDEELDDMIGKVYNIQKIEDIYRRKKYGEKQLFAHTVCTKCGREKRLFLSNLINDPEKYGSCICSDTNIDAKIDNIQKMYGGRKKIASNTSGYTGVSFVKTYNGEPYNKWRAYIDIDGVRTYLGDFTSKTKAVKARKEAGEKGIKWYNTNKNKLIRDVRKKSKKYATSKYRETQKKRSSVTLKDKK